MRGAVLEALVRVGGVDYLVRVAKEHPAVFCRLLAKLIPRRVVLADRGPALAELVEASECGTSAGLPPVPAQMTARLLKRPRSATFLLPHPACG
jgi:hypothetical protein